MFPLGVGTVASRTVVAVSTAVYNAALEVREKAIALTAQMLEAAEADLELVGGRVSSRVRRTGREPGRTGTQLTPFNTGVVPVGSRPVSKQRRTT